MIDYRKYINALRKCAKEHENDVTLTGHIVVSDLCHDTANLLESVDQDTSDMSISIQTIKDQMIKYGFNAPDMTVTEFVEDLSSAKLQETESIPASEKLSNMSVDAFLDKIETEIKQLTSRYSISRERGGMGQVEWNDRLISEDDISRIINKYKESDDVNIDEFKQAAIKLGLKTTVETLEEFMIKLSKCDNPGEARTLREAIKIRIDRITDEMVQKVELKDKIESENGE